MSSTRNGTLPAAPRRIPNREWGEPAVEPGVIAGPWISNGEIDAYSEKEDNAPARTKHAPVHRPGDGGDGPQRDRGKAQISHRQRNRAVAVTQCRGPEVGRKTRATRTARGEAESGQRIQHSCVLRYGFGQVRHLLADEDAGRPSRDTLQGRGTVFRGRLEAGELRPRGYAGAGELPLLRAAPLRVPQAVGGALRLGQRRRSRQAPRQPDPARDRALPRAATGRDQQEGGRRQIAAAGRRFHPGGQQDLPRGQSNPHYKRR